MHFGRLFNCIVLILLLGTFGESARASAQPTASDLSFTLLNTAGEKISVADFRGKFIVIEWFNPGCPFVKKHYRSGQMQLLQQKARDDGFVWLTINSTNSDHPDFADGSRLGAIAAEWGFKGTQLLLDPTGEVGKRFGAKTTPHMFILNPDGKVVYSGAIDADPDTTTDPTASRNYVRDAMTDLKAGKSLQVSETEPYGCSVKYGS